MFRERYLSQQHVGWRPLARCALTRFLSDASLLLLQLHESLRRLLVSIVALGGLNAFQAALAWLVAPHGQALVSKTTPAAWASSLPRYLVAALNTSGDAGLTLAHTLTATARAAPLEVRARAKGEGGRKAVRGGT